MSQSFDQITFVGPGRKVTVRIDGAEGNLWPGGNGCDGDLVIFASDGDNRSTDRATVHLSGNEGSLRLGGPGHDGDIALFPRPRAVATSPTSPRLASTLTASPGTSS